ncbi:hypothetical protein Aph01nite_43770 [Acrocarpospora phusangensis]|uniref:Uncharacterized protein n=1 Tax=Acrocarpospora phusangensis TaxID=1070424 RepID=A0A919QH14_9ACTN|nr:hypothetical protein [Acrocarpospora phusangensis]GIH26067.1 hypothetical protein Aph01nite_43770 [Acrocarpospora phusangensis]
MTWTTPTQASNWTRKALDQEDLDAAYPVIEIESGVTLEAAPGLKPRDLRLLKYAEAYQAAWMAAQVDVATRMDVDQVVQDGIQYSKGDPDAHVLAPLAARCLRKLSWRRSRSTQALTPAQAAARRGVMPPGTVDGTEEWLDDQQLWEPL